MLLLITICIIIVLVLGGIWIYTTQAIIKTNVDDYGHENSRFLATYTDLYLQNITSAMLAISTNPDTVRTLEQNDTRGLIQISDNLNSNLAQTGLARILDNNGHILYSTSHDNITSITDRYWYHDMEKNNTTYVSDLYSSRYANETAFAILTPIINNSTVIGRIMVIITPEDLQKSIREHSFAEGYETILFDSHGSVISSNNDSLMHDHTDLSSYLPVKMALMGDDGEMESGDTWDGKDRIIAYYPIRNTGWGAMTTITKDTAYAPLYQDIFWILGILILVILGSSILGFFAARYLTDPIIELSSDMQRFTSGSYAVRGKTGRTDEIGRLSDTFDKMVEGIKERDKKFKSEKELSDLYVDLMGHDINNMNQVGMGYLEMALEKIKQGGMIDENDLMLLEKAYGSLENSSQLIDNVKKLQKIKSGDIETEVIDLSRVLSDVSALYSSMNGRTVTINLESTTACYTKANPLINEVFSNIIGNAIKHSPPDTPLTIHINIEKVSDSGRVYCKITIDDNGPGIADSRKTVIFRHFAQGEGKTKGKGLGLYLVKTLVEISGGKIWVADRVPGDPSKGASFVIMLPSTQN